MHPLFAFDQVLPAGTYPVAIQLRHCADRAYALGAIAAGQTLLAASGPVMELAELAKAEGNPDSRASRALDQISELMRPEALRPGQPISLQAARAVSATAKAALQLAVAGDVR